MLTTDSLTFMKRTAILGFGNPVRSDDAIGIYVIDQLRDSFQSLAHIQIFDMGTSAFEVLFQLRGFDRFIIIDSVINSEEAVGTLFKVPAEEILRTPEDDPLVFLHALKWDQALSYAKKILKDQYPEDIMVYLIAIENIRLDQMMTKEVQQSGDQLVGILKQELCTT